jgi:hypothetical protein
MPVTDASFSKRVLLLGAGFSRNWGGLLANEVGGRMMAHAAVKARSGLGQLILHEPTFEDALEKSRTGPFIAADAAAMETALQSAFDEMDAGYKKPSQPVLGATINDFIGRFCPGAVAVGTGYVFSLNQDLLLERIYGTTVTRQKLTIPGITWLDRPPAFPAGAQPIPLASLVDPSTGNEPQLLRNFNYIKLHGSINWRLSGGSPSLVVGRSKPQTILQTPLLRWYHQIFEQVISSGDVRLMVIGYGWGDEHINAPIAQAVRNHGLQIYSWNPAHPTKELAGRPEGSDILAGVMGFSTRPMPEVMPSDPINSGSAHYNGIVRDFF